LAETGLRALAIDLADNEVTRMAVDPDGFVPKANLNIEALAKQVRAGQQELRLWLDHIAHEIGQATVGSEQSVEPLRSSNAKAG
jgi:hypothetical protein